MEEHGQQISRAARLRVLRIIWAALLMGQLIFLVVIVLAIWPGQRPEQRPDPDMLRILLIVGVAMLATMLPMSYILRRMIYGTPDAKGQVPAGKYASGNILLWAMSEGVSFFGLVGMMLDGKPWPFLAISLVAMAQQAITFPTASAMGADDSVTNRGS